jgi:hypothetical protein
MKTAQYFEDLLTPYVADNTELILLEERKYDALTFVERLKYYYQIKEVEVEFRSGTGDFINKPYYLFNLKAFGNSTSFMFRVYPEKIVIHSDASLPSFDDFDEEFIGSVMRFMNKYFIRTTAKLVSPHHTMYDDD